MDLMVNMETVYRSDCGYACLVLIYLFESASLEPCYDSIKHMFQLGVSKCKKRIW